jgi:hypothetical protein
MKRAIWLLPAILIFCTASRAQETPAWEVAGSYSYLKADLGGSNFHLNGVTASATENLNSWFGGRFEVSGYQGTVSGTKVSQQTITYGPVFSFRRLGIASPFVHVQGGVVRASAGYLGISQSAVRFAVVGGGGVDIKVARNAAVRLQGDYLMSNFLGQRQNNLQGSVGMVLRFGRK